MRKWTRKTELGEKWMLGDHLGALMNCVQLPQCVNIVHFVSFISLSLFPFLFFFLFEILWVYLLQTLTRRHLFIWVTKGFKRHVAYVKYNHNSYESELDVQFGFNFYFAR